MKFYLAGRFTRREQYLLHARRIEKLTDWECVSGWLTGDYEKMQYSEIANSDFSDIRKADVFILCFSKNCSGGMWVEFGYALSNGIKTVVWVSSEDKKSSSHPPPVFVALADMRVSSNVDELVKTLLSGF